jgi:hypothetical protein
MRSVSLMSAAEQRVVDVHLLQIYLVEEKLHSSLSKARRHKQTPQVQLHSFLTSAPDESEHSTSCYGRFKPTPGPIIYFTILCASKIKVHPRTGHEVPEGD